MIVNKDQTVGYNYEQMGIVVNRTIGLEICTIENRKKA